jgi:PAS domain S-box-containing protein
MDKKDGSYPAATMSDEQVLIINDESINLPQDVNAAKSQFDNLFNAMPICSFKLNAAGIIVDVNTAGSLLLGLETYSLIGKNISRYLAPLSQIIFPEFLANCFSIRDSYLSDLQFLNKDGPIIDCHVEGKFVESRSTQIEEIFIFVTRFKANKYVSDNEEQHKFRLGVIYRQNSINELSGIIAHELKNPLSVILNYVQGCIRRIESKNYQADDILKALKAASEQSHRVNELILRLKRFQSNKELLLEKCSIVALVESVIEILKNDISDFKVDLQFRSISECFVEVDKIYIGQLLLNLVRNAIDALRDAKIASPRVIIELNRLSKDKLQIFVIDNGPGYDPLIKDKLFDPHFTTKPYGIGVGLALSQSIAQAHKSFIDAEINALGGATFQFHLNIC